jgi:hypothetical protein
MPGTARMHRPSCRSTARRANAANAASNI